jgi:phosphotransferase system enzyme I (PtsI)
MSAPPPLESESLRGIAGSPGITVGRALVIDATTTPVARRRIGASDVDSELARYLAAVDETQRGFRDAAKRLAERRAEASILEAYVLMAGDELLADAVRAFIVDEHRSAEWAVQGAIEVLARRLGALDDAYLSERGHDVEFLGQRLIRALIGSAAGDLGARGGLSRGELSKLDEPTIVIARDLSPADTAAMVREPVVGFVTEVGTRTSHTAIIARALEIPAVLSVGDAVLRVVTGDVVIVDGTRGLVVVRPSEAELEDARARQRRSVELAKNLHGTRARAAATMDGTSLSLMANVEFPAEAALARDHGADGIGLYRTEFLYVDRAELPTEDQQFEVFRSVVEAMGPRPVTLRTFDIGGDKFVSTFQVPSEMNPMLGLRAVRLALERPDVFLEHLRAMVRATAHGDVRIMIPMVASLGELRDVRALLDRAMREVRARGLPCADEIPLGVMIEVPSAAVMADAFAREAAFLSLGTNDLVQYALAIDRTSRSLAYLASPFHPAILRLISGVVQAGHRYDRRVSVCGAMASDPLAAVLLVGLGVRGLSMEASAISEIKEALRRVTVAEAEAIAAEALTLVTAEEVERCVATAFAPRLFDLLDGAGEA